MSAPEPLRLTLDFYRAGDRMPDRDGRCVVVRYAKRPETQVCFLAPEEFDSTLSGRDIWGVLEEGARPVHPDDLWARIPIASEVDAARVPVAERDDRAELVAALGNLVAFCEAAVRSDPVIETIEGSLSIDVARAALMRARGEL